MKKTFLFFKKIVASLVIIFLVANPLTAIAYDIKDNVVMPYAFPAPLTPEDPPLNSHLESDKNVAITVRFNSDEDDAADGPGFTYAKYGDPRPYVPAVTEEAVDEFTGETYTRIVTPEVPAIQASCSDNVLNPLSVLEPPGTSPAYGFCEGMARCNNAPDIASIVDCSIAGKNGENVCVAVRACSRAVADAYNVKIVNALQSATNTLIEEKGLDKTKANSAIYACGGDLACIKRVLLVLKADGNFIKSTTKDPNAPLTNGDLSDLLNSSNDEVPDITGNQVDIGALNGLDNQGNSISKQSGPKVEVTFTGNPNTIGSVMKAKATPGFFNNGSDPKDLYFTWYLKREGCENDKNVKDNEDLKAKCDLDSDDKITENDWKIAAAKIIVNGGFNKDETDINGNKLTKYESSEYSNDIEKGSGYEAFPSPADEWEINSGADSNDDGAPDCYVQESSSGLTYELRKVGAVFGDCPQGYHRSCAYDVAETTCGNLLNPEYNQDDADTLLEKYLVPKTTTEKIGNFCFSSLVAQDIVAAKESQKCSVTDIRNFKAEVTCGSGKTAICTKDTGNTFFPESLTAPAKGVIFGDTDVCKYIFKTNLNQAVPPVSNPVPAFLKEKNTTYAALENQTCATIKDRITDELNGDTALNPSCGFIKKDNMCKHLFPKVPGEITGDGEFTIKEKQFWGANPKTISTNGKGSDEANIVGLGVDEFNWMLSSGDQVGVAVEGDSAYFTDHPDSSYKRMWAFSKGTCTGLEKLSSGDKGFYGEGEGLSARGFFTTEFDLNKCLEDNLIDPRENSATNLGVSLISTPENPINDSNENGDLLKITANPENTKNSTGLLYEWSVQKSNNGEDAPTEITTWTDITNKIISGGSFSEGDRVGLDKNQLSILLNINDSIIGSGDAFWLKIKVKIVGAFEDGEQDATGSVNIRIKKQQNGMRVYSVNASNAGLLSLNKNLPEQCSDLQGKTRCYVVKNQIVGLEVPNNSDNSLSNFSWSINGVDASCGATISSECTLGGNKLFFPVIGNEGEAINVSAAAWNEKRELIETSRNFIITNSELSIKSFDGSAWPKLLGYYKDLSNDGSCVQGANGCIADLSEVVMETFEGRTVILDATSAMGLEWSIDGQTEEKYTGKNQIELPINKTAGESYNIGLSTYLLPENSLQISNIRKALYKNWGIIQEEINQENKNANIQIDVLANPAIAIDSEKKGIFSASLITNLPTQLLFLFKISMTSILMLVLTGILFAFMPETIFKKEA